MKTNFIVVLSRSGNIESSNPYEIYKICFGYNNRKNEYKSHILTV